MERHSRLLLRFGHAMARAGIRMEAFAFGTRLTRITPMLRRRDPDSALREVSEAVGDWSGGTRIGHSFREFNQEWARRVLRTSGIVIVVSDGWDRGDPASGRHRDGATAAQLPPPGLAEPARRLVRVPAARAGDGRGVPVH